MKRRSKVIIGGFLAVLFIPIACLELRQILGEETFLTSSLAHAIFKNNFHTVSEGKFYRSGELSTEDLEKTIHEKGIKTVLDLRLGKEEGKLDVRAEEEMVEAVGSTYVHFPLRGSQVPSNEIILKLIGVLDHLETPVLVHCTSGTHRSGLVSAIWLMEREGVTPEVAAQQLSPRYGFYRKERELKSFVLGQPTIDSMLWIYLENTQKSGMTFRQWLTEWEQ